MFRQTCRLCMRGVSRSIRPTAPIKPRLQLQPIISRRTAVSTPTLGAFTETKLTNPFKDEDGTVLRVKISPNAAEKLNNIKKEDSRDDLVLRVMVESGGCHGFQYIMSLKDANCVNKEEDSIFERDGAKVVIDKTSLEVLKQSTIDYSTELIGSQFKVVDSPFTSSSCGCGASFSFDPK